MADQLQLRGGTTAQHATFTGALREVTVDTDKKTVVVHDGSTAGGNPLLRQDLSNLPAGTIDNADINASAGIVDTKLATIATAGKVSNSATTATNANTASAIVARDGSGNFTAGTITAALTGAASSNVLKAGDTMTGVLAVTAGTAALPAITPSGDPNTGIYSPGTDQLAIATGGVQRLLVDASGVVTATGDLQVASLNGGPLAGTRNRIINGDMRIDQRNAGAALNNAANGSWAVDRWARYQNVGASNIGRNLNSITPPAGFTNYLGIQISTAGTATASQYTNFQQSVEGFNAADFAWGTASAQSVTISFWVRSSLTGSQGFALQNAAAALGYPFTVNISAANTWEYKSITIPGPTTGTWDTTNGRGITLIVDLGMGSNFRFTSGSWQSVNVQGATGALNLNQTLNATFYITGVQLEPGTVATPFERRSYGQELALCQRYYQKSYQQDTKPGAVTGIGSDWFSLGGSYFGRIAITNNFSVVMRTLPSVVLYDWSGNANRVRTSGGDNQSGFVIQQATDRLITVDYGAGITELLYHYTASAEL
jgi:hypothetical protein